MTRRMERVGEVIKQEVSKIVLYKLQDPRVSLVTVTKVNLSPDLKMAKVYVAIHGDESAQEKTLDVLKHAKGYIQSEMAQCLKMRSTPSLSFCLDDTEKKSSHILQLIEKAVSEDN
jgi:ribosome-binding factor A